MQTSISPGPSRGRRIDDWLRAGGILIASSERAARSIRGTYNRRRQAEGLTAWPTPAIHEYRSFLRQQWDRSFSDHRLVLSALQEEWLFGRIAESGQHAAAVLHGPRLRLAAMAREAHELLCNYAPELLPADKREVWPGDAEVFSQWLEQFDRRCQEEGWLSSSRLPLEMNGKLSGEEQRPPLLLAGFDRFTPTQAAFFGVWGQHEILTDAPEVAATHFYETPDAASELAACALWCRARLEDDPSSRLLVISQDADLRRGEIERAFARHLDSASSTVPPLEFALGVPLAHTPLIRGGLLILRWITNKPLSENEVDWLLASNLTAESAAETAALQRQMKALRQRQLQRPEWTLESFINAQPGGTLLPESWTRRMLTAARRLQPLTQKHSALEWSELLPQSMKDLGWPGAHPMPSANFQVHDHWNKAIEATGTLGFDGQEISWGVFHSALARHLENSLFSPESQAARILISGPTQSAGLVADAIWFLGCEENTWPFSGQAHPFLPVFVQREAGMPHSSILSDAKLARTVTDRLLRSAGEVCFSMARLRAKAEANPSHMVLAIAGAPAPVPEEFVPASLPRPQTVSVEDRSNVPYTGTKAEGGAGTLTLQSQCAFRAFASARLGAQDWDPAEVGLNPRQRGNLVHDVLHSVWGGPAKNGLQSSNELQALLAAGGREGLQAFVRQHVEKVMSGISASIRDRMSQRYLELEAVRLTTLVTEWMVYESSRASFTVAETEQKTPVTVAGLALDLRLDRRDALGDGTSVVIDYKTGEADPRRWATERPEDVQLPLYAVFGAPQSPMKDPGGLVFGKVKVGEAEFSGRVRDCNVFLPSAGPRHAMVKNPLTDQQLLEWRAVIEKLASDFLAGRADVDPRDYPDTCEHCTLSGLCRVSEDRAGDVLLAGQ